MRTSTGAIIAALLATGMEVDEIKKKYMDLGGKIFGKKYSFWNPRETWQYLKGNYSYAALEQNLKECFGTATLGSNIIKTGLCIVAKRADTNSTWPLINHPDGHYYPKNSNIPLWQAVRASTAAPTYFAPQMIDVGAGQKAAFVDGGVSMANNPSLTLLMVATLKGFPFKWKLGEDHLSLVSVGTGYSIFSKQIKEISEAWMATWAKSVPDMLMHDASWQNQIILQWISDSPTACEIDREIGKLEGDYLGERSLLRYLRYNCPLTENDLNGLQLGKNFTQKEVESIIEMSNSQNREVLYNIGEAAANREVKEMHFEKF